MLTSIQIFIFNVQFSPPILYGYPLIVDQRGRSLPLGLPFPATLLQSREAGRGGGGSTWRPFGNAFIMFQSYQQGVSPAVIFPLLLPSPARLDSAQGRRAEPRREVLAIGPPPRLRSVPSTSADRGMYTPVSLPQDRPQ